MARVSRAPGPRYTRKRPPLLVLLLPVLGLVLLAAACTPGPYPLDFFAEMHVSQAPERLQPDRASAPADAVPITGRAAAMQESFAQAHDVQSPVATTSDALARAQQIAAVNCAMCHGSDGRGDSPLVPQFSAVEANPPPSFASARVQGRTDGELYWIIGHGLGNMPAFQRLLSDQDIWTVVQFVRAVGSGGTGTGTGS